MFATIQISLLLDVHQIQKSYIYYIYENVTQLAFFSKISIYKAAEKSQYIIT